MTRARPPASLLVNPVARHTRQSGWLARVRALLAPALDVEVLCPESTGETTALARRAAELGREVVIAAGGDGTINAAASGLADTGVPLGILPLGTANDLARELGVPRSLDGAARRIAAGEPRAMDLVTANGASFCTVGGLGLVSRSTRWATCLKRRPLTRRAVELVGSEIYKLTATAGLLGHRISERLHLTYDDADTGRTESLELEAHALFVANHRTLGGGMVLPVAARADDGVFELCLVPRRARHSLMLNFARLSAGRPLTPGVLRVLRATHAVVETSRRDTFVGDGELLASGTRFELGVRPGALLVV